MEKYITQALALVRKLWAKEPARVVSVTAAAIVAVCAIFGIVIPVESVTTDVAIVVPILLGGEVIRSQVSPAAAPKV